MVNHMQLKLASLKQEMLTVYEELLNFWFHEIDREFWWKKDAAFDQRLTKDYGELHQRAARCELFKWRETVRGCLAEIIVLDQFSRHIYRDLPLAFANDPLALALAQQVVATGVDRELSAIERNFLYFPYMHSESPLIHQQAVVLYEQNGLAENLGFELRHKAIIDRFGRYPHRNSILNRASTEEELEFLKQPGSSF